MPAPNSLLRFTTTKRGDETMNTFEIKRVLNQVASNGRNTSEKRDCIRILVNVLEKSITGPQLVDSVFNKDCIDVTIKMFLENGRFIQAIKFYKMVTGSSLIEAKAYVSSVRELKARS